MSAVQNLEALINVENQLKNKYESQISELSAKLDDAENKQAQLQATIEQQIAKIAELSSSTMDSKRLEQLNREVSNRNEKLLAEIETLKNRAKTGQKELVDLKSELKALKQLEPEKLKKNLIAAKKKNDEQRDANELLKKSAKQTKADNLELQKEIETLKEELEKLKAQLPAEENTELEDVKESEAA